MKPCPRCNGDGVIRLGIKDRSAGMTNMINAPAEMKCSDCNGAGSIRVIFPLDVVCPKCHSCENVKCTERGKGIITRVFTDTFHEERIAEAEKREGQEVEQ
jgi:DnaJ-class molecular chaperone